MIRTILPLLLVLGHVPLAVAARTRAVKHPGPVAAPTAIVTAAHQAAEAALNAGVPAVQIAVSHGGQIIYSEAFGVTNTKSATPATSRSVMQIGSVTKQFTAAEILRLAEHGALTLDDRIEKFVPEFDPRGAQITLRHLLNHTSGIPRDWYAPDAFEDTNSLVTREHVIKSMNALPFEFAPGKGWSYSNAGYMLLGYAIESITGRLFADVIHEEWCRSGSSTPACAERTTCRCLEVTDNSRHRTDRCGCRCPPGTGRFSGRPVRCAPPRSILPAGRTFSQPASSCCPLRTRR